MTEVQELNGDQGGSQFVTNNNIKSTIDDPVIIPKPDVLPDVYLDNGDGTITIPPPPPNTYNVTPDGNTAIDNLNVPDDVKDEYKEVLESNNGLKVKKFIDDLPADQANEIYQLQETQELVQLPGEQEAELDVAEIEGIPLNTTDKKELAAARSYDNIANQQPDLPTRTEIEEVYGGEEYSYEYPIYQHLNQSNMLTNLDKYKNIQYLRQCS